ncbi:hypothetical protein HHX47_DHR5000147 [Lentinula edodes]|nr:hypothetical protein HHX47_DHR5000147 [Lentinula edodes]
MPKQPASFFPTTAIDHAAAGLGAGVVSTLCMNPLDLLKVKFQVATSSYSGGIGKQIWYGLKDIYRESGFKGLYRGVGPNVAGNASSWGLYFLFYNMLKKRAAGGDITQTLSAQEILLCSAQASAVTAVMTNPIWVVKVRMFTSPPGSPQAYQGLFHGFKNIVKVDGVQGLFRGTSLALVGVSNGALQFMAYEKMKKWGFDMKRQQSLREGRDWNPQVDKLNDPQLYPTIRSTVSRTWSQEGYKGFYRGLATNLVRILPGTCVTFVVYENLAWLLRSTAAKRD